MLNLLYYLFQICACIMVKYMVHISADDIKWEIMYIDFKNDIFNVVSWICKTVREAFSRLFDPLIAKKDSFWWWRTLWNFQYHFRKRLQNWLSSCYFKSWTILNKFIKKTHALVWQNLPENVQIPKSFQRKKSSWRFFKNRFCELRILLKIFKLFVYRSVGGGFAAMARKANDSFGLQLFE